MFSQVPCSTTGPSAEARGWQTTCDSVPEGLAVLRGLWPAQKVLEWANSRDRRTEGPPRCLLEAEPSPLDGGSSGLGHEGMGRAQGAVGVGI